MASVRNTELVFQNFFENLELFKLKTTHAKAHPWNAAFISGV